MASGQGKHMPKDTQIIVSIMKDLGISEYDQQVLNHLLEFNYRYATLLLEDAKTFSNFAKKKNIDADDVQLAIRMAQEGVFFKPTPRDVLMATSHEVNKIPLPAIKPATGLRIPHDRSNFLQTNYRLVDNLDSGSSTVKQEAVKTTAAELLASRKMTVDHHNINEHSEPTMSSSLDFDLHNMMEQQQCNRESVEENDKVELMDTQTYDNHSFGISLDDSVAKHLDNM